jgi:oligopeptide transport system substrate-binding protein
MALDRPQLIAAFNIGGWVPTTRVVAPGLPAIPATSASAGRARDRGLRAVAAGASPAGAAPMAARARADAGDRRAPGLDLLFRELAAQLATIGVKLDRVRESAPADLVLVDRVARYAEPRWFLTSSTARSRTGFAMPMPTTWSSRRWPRSTPLPAPRCSPRPKPH